MNDQRRKRKISNNKRKRSNKKAPHKRKSPQRKRTPRKSTDTRTIKLKKNYKAGPRMNDGYVRPKGKTKQDLISEDTEQMKKLFEGYKKIKPTEYKNIAEGTHIRYLKDGKYFRFGGFLMMNKYPDYWVLKNRNKKGKITTWCVPLKAKNVYAQKIKTEADYMPKSMKELYKAIESGDVKLLRKSQQGGAGGNRRRKKEEDNIPYISRKIQFDDIQPSEESE